MYNIESGVIVATPKRAGEVKTGSFSPARSAAQEGHPLTSVSGCN